MKKGFLKDKSLGYEPFKAADRHVQSLPEVHIACNMEDPISFENAMRDACNIGMLGWISSVVICDTSDAIRLEEACRKDAEATNSGTNSGTNSERPYTTYIICGERKSNEKEKPPVFKDGNEKPERKRVIQRKLKHGNMRRRL